MHRSSTNTNRFLGEYLIYGYIFPTLHDPQIKYQLQRLLVEYLIYA